MTVRSPNETRTSDTILAFALIVSDGESDSTASEVHVTVLAATDSDGDGLDDLQESTQGTDPSQTDTDQDGLDDGQKIARGTNPLHNDSDDDGLLDGEEGKTCPSCEDFQPDAAPDGDLVIAALDADTDDDGVLDGTELSVREPRIGGGAGAFAYLGTDSTPGAFVADEDPDTSTNP